MSLLESLTPQAAKADGYKYEAATGSGIKQVIDWSGKMNLLTPVTLNAVVPELPTLFGGYPYPSGQATDIGPASLFIGVFAVLGLACMYITIMNVRRGHNFFLLFGLGSYCILKVIGFSCRVAWAYNVTRLNIGVCSIVFTQVAQLVLLALNKTLAHRIFTWRHPETGNSWWVKTIINLVYLMVLGIIAMAIVGQALPFLYFMTQYHFNICQNVMQTAAVLNVVYAVLPFNLLFLAYVFKPGQLSAEPWKAARPEDDLPPVVQPYWIENPGIFYYVQKESVLKIYKNDRAAHAIRIMPSCEPPAAGLHHCHYKVHNPKAPSIVTAIWIVCVGSFFLLLNTCFRCASTFQRSRTIMKTDPAYQNRFTYSYWVHHPYVMYIFYGGVEALVLAFYLITRIDLRFYIPDMPSRKENPNPNAESLEIEEPILSDSDNLNINGDTKDEISDGRV